MSASTVFARVSHPRPKVAKLSVDYQKTKVAELSKLGLKALELGQEEENYRLHSLVAYQQDVINLSSIKDAQQTLSAAKVPPGCSLYFSCTKVQPLAKVATISLGAGAEGKAEQPEEEDGVEASPGKDGKLKLKGITEDNALDMLAKAKSSAKREAVLEFIDKKAKKVLESKAFLKQDMSVALSLVKRDTLGIKEPKLLQCLVAYAKHGPGRELKEFKPFIRFGLFKVKEIASQLMPLGLLSQAENVALFTYASQRDAGKKDAELPGFPEVATKKREGPMGDYTWCMKNGDLTGVVSEEDGALLVSQPYTGQNVTVRVDQGFSKEQGGVHTYEFDIIDMSSNTSFRAGLVTDKFNQWRNSGWAIGNGSNQRSCGFYSGTMNAGGMGSTSGRAPSFNSGVTIRMQLDMERMRWSYGPKGSTTFSGYISLRNQSDTFYPAVTFYDSRARTSVRIRAVDNPEE